jgi:hypothetical protein
VQPAHVTRSGGSPRCASRAPTRPVDPPPAPVLRPAGAVFKVPTNVLRRSAPPWRERHHAAPSGAPFVDTDWCRDTSSRPWARSARTATTTVWRRQAALSSLSLTPARLLDRVSCASGGAAEPDGAPPESDPSRRRAPWWRCGRCGRQAVHDAGAQSTNRPHTRFVAHCDRVADQSYVHGVLQRRYAVLHEAVRCP